VSRTTSSQSLRHEIFITDNNAGNISGTKSLDGLLGGLLLQAAQIADLRVAQLLDSAGMQLIKIAGQCQRRLLDPRGLDLPFHSLTTGQQSCLERLA